MSDAPDSKDETVSNAEDETADAVESPGVIAPAFVAQFVGAIGDGDKPFLVRTIKDLHPADAADLLEHLPPDGFRKAVHILGKDLPAEAVAELSDEMRLEALNELTDEAIVAMTGHLDT